MFEAGQVLKLKDGNVVRVCAINEAENKMQVEYEDPQGDPKMPWKQQWIPMHVTSE